MPEKFDYKKDLKPLYLPGKKPVVLQVPPLSYIMVDGMGAPESEAYQGAISILYALTFTIKMSKMSGRQPEGYFEYAVPPLEGLWTADAANLSATRDKWGWTSMIMQPEFVTPGVMAWAKEEAAKKKPDLDFSKARLETLDEGLCVQAMHTGPFATEPETTQALRNFLAQNGYVEDYSPQRRHHEIYLKNPRRTAPQNLKTVLRLPVKKAE